MPPASQPDFSGAFAFRPAPHHSPHEYRTLGEKAKELKRLLMKNARKEIRQQEIVKRREIERLERGMAQQTEFIIRGTAGSRKRGPTDASDGGVKRQRYEYTDVGATPTFEAHDPHFDFSFRFPREREEQSYVALETYPDRELAYLKEKEYRHLLRYGKRYSVEHVSPKGGYAEVYQFGGRLGRQSSSMSQEEKEAWATYPYPPESPEDRYSASPSASSSDATHSHHATRSLSKEKMEAWATYPYPPESSDGEVKHESSDEMAASLPSVFTGSPFSSNLGYRRRRTTRSLSQEEKEAWATYPYPPEYPQSFSDSRSPSPPSSSAYTNRSRFYRRGTRSSSRSLSNPMSREEIEAWATYPYPPEHESDVESEAEVPLKWEVSLEPDASLKPEADDGYEGDAECGDE